MTPINVKYFVATSKRSLACPGRVRSARPMPGHSAMLYLGPTIPPLQANRTRMSEMPSWSTVETDRRGRLTPALLIWAAGLLGIAAIGGVDYLSGTELRVYPLYFAPVGLLAWQSGRAGAIAAAVLCVVTWFASNRLAGMQFSSSAMWVANTAVHGVSFAFVGLLIATLHRSAAEARTLSNTDALTQLRNNRAFFADTAPLLALCRRTHRPVTLAYIDLDGFKEVNDRHGHQAGDALLRNVAGAIRHAVRPSDLCARVGGDEFVVVLPELGAREAVIALERMRMTVRGAVITQYAGISASIGAVTVRDAPADLEILVRHADRLMYTAKTAGGDRVAHEVIAADDTRPGEGA